MGGIERRRLMKSAAVGGVALSLGAARLAKEARAQEGLPAVRSWPNKRLLDLLKIEHPLIQAPMGLHTSPAMPVAVCKAGGLGSFPCSALTPAQLRDVVGKIRAQTDRPLNLNFFSHRTERIRCWKLHG